MLGCGSDLTCGSEHCFKLQHQPVTLGLYGHMSRVRTMLIDHLSIRSSGGIAADMLLPYMQSGDDLSQGDGLMGTTVLLSTLTFCSTLTCALPVLWEDLQSSRCYLFALNSLQGYSRGWDDNNSFLQVYNLMGVGRYLQHNGSLVIDPGSLSFILVHAQGLLLASCSCTL